jgi:hypothetical protein
MVGMADGAPDDENGYYPNPGPGVDLFGRAVLDPTRNVDALVQAAVRRLDDLREMESNHQRELAALRDHYDESLREAESKRIDAIRAVDVGAVNRAAEVSATQATTLATQVAVSADTLRGQVAAAAQAQTTALAAALDPIQKDIADLRRAQYEAIGVKAQVVDSRAGGGFVFAAIGLAITVVLATVTIVSVILSTK